MTRLVLITSFFVLLFFSSAVNSQALVDCISEVKLIGDTYTEVTVVCENPYTLLITYGEVENSLDQESAAKQLLLQSSGIFKKKFTLDGLLPGTQYFYKVVQDISECAVGCELPEGVKGFFSATSSPVVVPTAAPIIPTLDPTTAYTSGSSQALLIDCISEVKLIANTYTEVTVVCQNPYTLFIAYGKVESSLDQESAAKQLLLQDSGIFKKKYTLGDLLPATQYFYRVVQDVSECSVGCEVPEGVKGFISATNSPVAPTTTDAPTLTPSLGEDHLSNSTHAPSSGPDSWCKQPPPSMILSQPTDHSITVIVRSLQSVSVSFRYGTTVELLNQSTPTLSFAANTTGSVILDGLLPGTQYFYLISFSYLDLISTCQSQDGDVHFFSTKANPLQSFTFAVTADTHWGEWTSDEREVYRTTLRSIFEEAAVSDAHFMVELGDTFMGSKMGLTKETIHKPYEDLFRNFYSATCHSLPLYLVNGNHDGEQGWKIDGEESGPVWTAKTRKEYFPPPLPTGVDAFYTGNEEIQFESLGLQGDYYSWHWGGALFVVLDPYWYTINSPNEKANNPGWEWTLGRQQHSWLYETLTTSDAPFKFVMTHALLGGAFGNETEKDYNGVGDARWAHYFEWGGHDEDGRYAFDEYRPGWLNISVHGMMLEASGKVVVLKGHDHVFATSELDGVVHQTVPPPCRGLHDGKKGALNKGGYDVDNVLDEDEGYVSITVNDPCAQVAFRSPDGVLIHDYSICL